MSDLFKDIVKQAKIMNERAFILNEENPYKVDNWVPTSCYALNAVLSDGDIFKGIPDGKRIMISGAQSTAKSLYTAFIIKTYLSAHPTSYAIFFETEGSSTVDMAKSVGIPEDRMIIIPVLTVEECKTSMVSLLDKIIDRKEGYVSTVTKKDGIKRRKLTKEEIKKQDKFDEKFIFVIDSLGMLSTNKEVNDVATGSDKRDMTRAQLIRGMARVTSLKFSIAQTPLIIVNHTYGTTDKYNPFEISGGGGGKYMADIILLLEKYKDKEGTKQVGVRIKTTIFKSRYARENMHVDIYLHFKKGLYKYSSLVDLAYEELGVLKKSGISFILPDGSTAKMKDVRMRPSQYLTDENLNVIRDAIYNEFRLGDILSDQEVEYDDSDIEDDVEFSDENYDESNECNDDII